MSSLPIVVSTGQLGNARHVGSGDFDTLQAAHDDLPETGGLIIMTGPTAETGSVFTKPMTIIGPGSETHSWATNGRDAVIDTSGGNGLWFKDHVQMWGVAVEGGGGDYDLRIGIRTRQSSRSRTSRATAATS